MTGSLVNSLNICHYVRLLTFSPDSTRIAGFEGTNIRIWNVSDGHPVGQPLSHADLVHSFVFAADWKLISLFGCQWDPEDMYICKWDIYIHASLEPEAPRITSATLFPHGTRIALESDNGVACWRDIGTGATTLFKGVVEGAAFSPDGARIVSSSRDDIHPYRLWCARSGKPVGQPFGTGRWDGDVLSVSFSPDGKRIACGLGDGLKYVLLMLLQVLSFVHWALFIETNFHSPPAVNTWRSSLNSKSSSEML
jgi:WD40 repeat protein